MSTKYTLLAEDALEGVAPQNSRGIYKSVTIMSVDVMGSTSLIQDLDAELARNLLAPVLKIMVDAVNHYEGTVICMAGDGLIATFGGPKVIAAHALKACCAALFIKKEIKSLNAAIELRIGLHSGEISFEIVGDAQHTEYHILGQAVDLTLLIEKTAPSGAIKLTQHTLDLVRQNVQVIYLEDMLVEDWGCAISTYELLQIYSDTSASIAVKENKFEQNELLDDCHLRKFASVMFAEIKESAPLKEGKELGQVEENARILRTQILTTMLASINRYGGTVIHIFAEHVVATFGAPESAEDHALRAALAALTMKEELKAIDSGAELRIGLNSGEIYLERSYDPKHKQYDITGPTVNLAARMEQTAKSGSIQITKRFLSLLQADAQAEFLGSMKVKGFKKMVEVFELKSLSDTHSLFEVKNRPFHSPFIGRNSEMQFLQAGLQKIQAGQGVVANIISGAGLGKSRLCFEFLATVEISSCHVYVSKAYSHTNTIFLHPIAQLFRNLVDLENLSFVDDADAVLQKVQPFIARSSLPLAQSAILSLLGMKPREVEWGELEPALKNAYIFKAGLEILSYISQQDLPLILLIEDMHFFDDGTEAFLNFLIPHIRKLPIMLLLTSRIEYQNEWMNTLSHNNLFLNPLSPTEGRAMLDELLGNELSLEEIKTKILNSSGGNPFYLEEMIKLLVEDGTLTGASKPYKLNAIPVESKLKLPESIYTILQAQIDKLYPYQREVLEAASVIGEIFSYNLILNLLPEKSQKEIRAITRELCNKKYIYEKSIYPEYEFSFMNSMIGDVCYKNLLIESRKKLHAKLLGVYEKLYPFPLPSQIQIMAHHAYFGEQWEKAFNYCLEGAENAFETNALKLSLNLYLHAMSATEHLKLNEQLVQKIAYAQVEIYHLLMRFGRLEEGEEHLKSALDLACSTSELSLQAAIYMFKTVHVFGMQNVNMATEFAEHANRLEELQKAASGEAYIEPIGRTALVHAYFFTWQYEKLQAMGHAILADVVDLNRIIKPFRVSPGHLSYLFMTLGMAFKGDFLNGKADRKKWQAGINDELSVGCCMFNLAVGMFYYAKSDYEIAYQHLLNGTRIAIKIDLIIVLNMYYATLGCTCLRLGKFEEGRNYIEQAINLGKLTKFVYLMATSLTAICEGLLLMKEYDRAQEFTSLSLEICEMRHLTFLKPALLRLKAQADLEIKLVDLNEIEKNLLEALQVAESLELFAETAHINMELAKLSKPPLKSKLVKALAIYKRLEMPYWQSQAEQLLDYVEVRE